MDEKADYYRTVAADCAERADDTNDGNVGELLLMLPNLHNAPEV
jgi:hypothetical protein